MPIFTFVANATHVVGVFFLVGLVFLFHDLFVSSFILYDESEHFALCRVSVLVERRPSSPDFGRLLLLESNHLAQVSRAFSSCQYFDFYVIDFNFFFVSELRLLWLLRSFVFLDES